MAREAACFHSFAFRRCDYKNLGVSFLCNFEEQIQGQQIQPPIWGQNVLKQYLDEINEVPDYLESLARNSNKVKIFLEQREVAFLSPSKICENLNFSIVHL